MNDDKIKSFSDKHDLWARTLSMGLECLQNYLAGGAEGEPGEIKGLTADRFVFAKKDQQIISFRNTEQSFIIRTTFDLKTTSGVSKKISGYYSLDVDKDANVIDDWLVFN